MAFIDEKKEYTIENMFPKRPMMNFLWNEEYIAAINQFGFGKGRYSTNNNFQHDIVRDSDSRIIYIKDEDKIFSPNRNYNREKFDEFKSIVGIGYSKIVSEYDDIHTELTIMVPTKGKRECWKLAVKNLSDSMKNIDLYSYTDIDVQLTEHLSCTYGDFDEALNGIYFKHYINNMPSDYYVGYVASNMEVTSYDTAKRTFIGTYGSYNCPDGVKCNMLASKDNSFDAGTIAAIHSTVSLKPKETKTFNFVIGAEKTVEAAAISSKAFLTEKAFDDEMTIIKKNSEQYDDMVCINTPDEEVNRFVNIWLKRQMELGKTWGRVYNKGFRDIMQDISGFVQLDADVSRAKILDCAQYQLESGNTLRSWVPIDRRPYRDGAVWLLQTVVCYVKETADKTILDEKISYFESDIVETLFEHCIRGIEFLYREVGKHGLCLWGGGDWNDSFDGAGLKMIGESVWLSIAAVKASKDFIELLLWLNKKDLADIYQAKCSRLTENIQKFGWDKDHYIYGINDWNEKVGSYETDEGQIFLNPQTWAVIAGIAKDNDKLLDTVEDELSCDFGYVQQKPCYKTANPHLGRIAYFGNGFYENGSVYNHGVAFKIVADCIAKKGNYAYKTVKKMFPSNPLNNYQKSGVEPYALCNMYFGPENKTRSGEAPMYWITGTSSWTFRGIVEYIIGVRADFDGLIIDPQLPDEWDKIKITRKFRNCRYVIEIKRTGRKSISVDGSEIQSNNLPCFNDNKIHNVSVTL